MYEVMFLQRIPKEGVIVNRSHLNGVYRPILTTWLKHLLMSSTLDILPWHICVTEVCIFT